MTLPPPVDNSVENQDVDNWWAAVRATRGGVSVAGSAWRGTQNPYLSAKAVADK